MKNYSVSKNGKVMIYNPQLRVLAKSISATILFQQIEYWFGNTSGESFYKFLEPCSNPFYRKGDSWTEELGFSADEFRTAFDKIGIRYSSKTEYDLKVSEGKEKENDVFQGMFYLSYHDKIKGLTYYIRNHSYTDEKISEIFSESNESTLGKLGNQVCVNQETPSTQTENPRLEYTENTSSEHSENKTEKKEKKETVSEEKFSETPSSNSDSEETSEKTEPPKEKTEAPQKPDDKITIGNFLDKFLQLHSEFSPKRTKATKESADRKCMPYDDLDCELRMSDLISLAKMYDEVIWRSNELTAWHKGKGFNSAMPVTVSYLTRKKKDIEDAFSSLPVMDEMDRRNKEHNEYLSTLNAPKTSSQIIDERIAAGEVIDWDLTL